MGGTRLPEGRTCSPVRKGGKRGWSVIWDHLVHNFCHPMVLLTGGLAAQKVHKSTNVLLLNDRVKPFQHALKKIDAELEAVSWRLDA